MLEVIGEQLSIPVVDLSQVKINPTLLKLIPPKVVHRYRLIPISNENGTIRIATANAFDLYAFDELRMLTGTKVEPVLASEAEIQRAIKQFYGVGGQTIEDMLTGSKTSRFSTMPSSRPAEKEIEQAQEATVVKLVNEILLEAIRDRASDVHIEPLRRRLAHSLSHRRRAAHHQRPAADSPVPERDHLAHQDPLEPEHRREAFAPGRRLQDQDGQNREIDLRVSIVPTVLRRGRGHAYSGQAVGAAVAADDLGMNGPGLSRGSPS